MSAAPIRPPEGPVPERIRLVPLAEVDAPALIQFADELVAVPRYFGSGAIPRPSARWRSMLCHPAALNGVAALVGDELVGVARLCGHVTGGAHLYLAVAPPWRRRGVGSALAEASLAIATRRQLRPLVAIVEHHKAPVKTLARRYHVDTVQRLAS